MNHASSHTTSVRKGRLRSDRGQAIIEFGLVVIFLFVMVLSILEMVVFMHTYNVLADSAKEGVRYAIVHGKNNPQGLNPGTSFGVCTTCPDLTGNPAPSGTIAGYNSGYGIVKSFAQWSLHDTSNMTVTVTYGPADTPAVTPPNKTPNLVQVTVSYPYSPIFGLSWPTFPVKAAAEGRIMN